VSVAKGFSTSPLSVLVLMTPKAGAQLVMAPGLASGAEERLHGPESPHLQTVCIQMAHEETLPQEVADVRTGDSCGGDEIPLKR
jgi:hypothetical protein